MHRKKRHHPISTGLTACLWRGCPTYTASTDLFAFGVKTPKSRSAVGLHDIGIEVRASNGTTVLGFVRVVVQLT